jgi:hypothetical protein
MKILIFKKLEDGSYGEKLASYEADYIDNTSTNRSYLLAEPNASHFELPEGLDEDVVKPVWGIIHPAHTVVLEEERLELVSEALLDEEGNEIQPAVYDTIPARTLDVAAVEGWILEEDADLILAKRQRIANENLNGIRSLREPLLVEADHKINKLEDDELDASAWRAYRKALRECTDDLKKQNGEAKLMCENINPMEFEFPQKPE